MGRASTTHKRNEQAIGGKGKAAKQKRQHAQPVPPTFLSCRMQEYVRRGVINLEQLPREKRVRLGCLGSATGESVADLLSPRDAAVQQPYSSSLATKNNVLGSSVGRSEGSLTNTVNLGIGSRELFSTSFTRSPNGAH